MAPADLPAHITVTPNGQGGLDSSCAVCEVTASTGPRFGSVPAQVFSDTFVDQHRTHPGKGANRG